MLAYMEHTLHLWGNKSLDSRHPCSESEGLENVFMSKAWYFTPLLPLSEEAWASPASKHQPNQCWPNKSATTWPPEANWPSTLGMVL